VGGSPRASEVKTAVRCRAWEAATDGIHDLGGMHGFGPVEREENEPPFHARWEAAMVAIIRSGQAAGFYSIDEFRHSIERMDPAHYLGSSYFEHWLDGIARLLIEKGVVTAEEMEARTAFFRARPQAPLTAAPRKPATPGVIRGRPEAETSFRDATRAPRFAEGAPVATRTMHPTGHTRLPRYARGKRGVIAAHRGVHVFPDAHAHGLGEQPQPVYSVRFDARELWGEVAEPNQHVYLDLWESYLLPG
jgi:nitrile hydratase subunit beta